MRTKFLVTAPPPTANGDLHVGHISGPYFAADIFSRFKRISGHEVIYASGSDNNQTYVVTTGERKRIDPLTLAHDSYGKISESLKLCSISMDAFTMPDEEHTDFVKKFIKKLFEKGKLEEKTTEYWYSKENNRYLFEAYIDGYCPNCCQSTKGGICEACGHPNDSFNIAGASETGFKNTLEKKAVKGLFLPLEKYRTELTGYYNGRKSKRSEHLNKLIEDLLSKPLPDFPVSYPSSYGIPFPVKGYEECVVNVWAEMVPGLMNSTAKGSEKGVTEFDQLWKPDENYRLVQFLGFDNSYFFAVAHIALLIAADENYILPSATITNEFYQLENFKFSTSQNHVIWARDMIKEYPVDHLRFYVAFTNPESFETNFSKQDFEVVVNNYLAKPWSKLASLFNELINDGDWLTVRPGAAILDRLKWYYAAFEKYYDAEDFSINKSVRLLISYIKWLHGWGLVQKIEKAGTDISSDLAAGLLALCSYAYPILPDFSEKLAQHLAVAEINWSLPYKTEFIKSTELPSSIFSTMEYESIS